MAFLHFCILVVISVFHFFLGSSTRGLSILFILPKKPALGFIVFSIVLFKLCFIYFLFNDFLLPLSLGFVCSFLILGGVLGFFLVLTFFFWKKDCIAVNIPLGTAWLPSVDLCCCVFYCHFSQDI